MSRPVGFNLIGAASSNTGLGVVTREYAKALIANGHSVSIFDMEVGGGRSGLNLSLQDYFAPSLEAMPHDINIWIIGANGINHCALKVCRSAHLQTKFNAVMAWWELPDLPPLWTTSALAFDAIVCASEFVYESWARNVSRTPILLAPAPLEMPVDITPDRARFGLPDRALLIYTGFEAASDTVRKNPLAAVEAFRRAFPNDSNVRLVIKVNNPDVEGKLHHSLARLYGLIENDERVILLRDRLGYRDLLSLYASCDVIVSLHRSEGLGLMPLEAMRLGRAVVATGWSGNMTYMNYRNAGLVSYDLVATDDTATHYSPSELGVASYWAEPSIDHAAAWLRAFAEDETLRLAVGQQATQDSLSYNELALRTTFGNELAALHQQRSLTPATNYKQLLERIRIEVNQDELRRIGIPWRQLAPVWRAVVRQANRHLLWRFQGDR